MIRRSAATPASGLAAPLTLRRNAALALGTQLTTGVFTAGLTLYLVRVLGPTSFGTYALAAGVGEIVLIFADFGIPLSASRFIAEERHDVDAVSAILRAALRVKVASAGLVALALVMAAGPIAAAYHRPEMVTPLRLAAVVVFGQSVMMLFVNAYIGLGRNDLNLRLVFAKSVAETVASVALVAGGTGVVGAMAGRGIGYAVGGTLALVVAVRMFGRSIIGVDLGDASRSRMLLAYAGPLAITNSAYTLYSQIDILIIGAMLGPHSVGLFAAPLRLVVPFSYIGQAIANAVAPRQGLSRNTQDLRAFRTSLRLLLVYQTLLVVPVAVWARPIVDVLLGRSFEGSGQVLRVMALFIFLRGFGPLITTTVNYLGKAARRIPIVLFALVLNVVIDVLLLPAIGVVGAAIGTGVAYAVYISAHFVICRRELGVPLRPLAITAGHALIAGAAAAGVMALIGLDRLSSKQWVVGGLAGIGVFTLLLLLTREISRAEVAQLFTRAPGAQPPASSLRCMARRKTPEKK